MPQTFYGLTFDPGRRTAVRKRAPENAVVYQFAFADGLLSDRSEIAIGNPAEKRFVPAGLTCSGDGKTLYVANAWGDSVAVVALQTKMVANVELEKDSYPYLALPTADGKRLLVSLWNGSGVEVVDLVTQRSVGRWTTPSHPTEMVLSPQGDTLYIACANSNSVAVFDVATGRPLETICQCTLASYRELPLSSHSQ